MSLFKSTKQAECCPECGAPLQLKRGRQGLFLGCSNYPDCHYLKPLQQTYHVIKDLDELCPECGQSLQIKQGHFGIFIGCSAYPSCHFMVTNESEEQEEINCPVCKLHKLAKRFTKRGKSFYGCTGYPACKFSLFGQPIQKECPVCGFSLMIQKNQRGKTIYQCANRVCQHLVNINK